MVVDVAEGAEDLARVRNGSDWSTFRVPEETSYKQADASNGHISRDFLSF